MRRVLIANRSEIALRVVRACRELSLESVAVYSTADESALHVREADHAVCIGKPAARQSYLSIEALLAAARESRADAVHPGYGFLAENAEFVRACVDNDLVFIGPSAEVVEQMGDRAETVLLLVVAIVAVVVLMVLYVGGGGSGGAEAVTRRPPGGWRSIAWCREALAGAGLHPR